MKILVIDDSDDDLYITKRIVSKHYPHIEIKAINMAEPALDYLKSPDEVSLPDFIFLDIRMPVMDGFGFLAEYEKLPEHVIQHCKLYMLTSSEDKNDRKRAKENKYVVDYIIKPVQKDVFKEIFG